MADSGLLAALRQAEVVNAHITSPLEPQPLQILAVAPSQSSNILDTPITINGTGFEAVLSGTQVIIAPVVTLG